MITAKTQKWIAVIAFVLVILITGIFVVRTVRRAAFWRQHRDEVIRPWMSVPYIAHSYRVPPHVLYQALGISPQPHDRRPLKQIAREQNRQVDQVINVLNEAIAHERASNPPLDSSPKPGRSP
jgi:ABC-type nickel/cobalt efflux system permease component RcnA